VGCLLGLNVLRHQVVRDIFELEELNENVAYKNIIVCRKASKLRQLGKILYKVR